MALAPNIQNLATRIATEVKALRTLINGNAADLSALNTVHKANLVEAINDVAALVADAGAHIDDTGASTTTVYSSQRTTQLVATAVADLVNGAPEALDTLQELAAALEASGDAVTAINEALANRVRVDAPQTFTEPQMAQARDNIGAISAAAIGDPETDFVATFEAGL